MTHRSEPPTRWRTDAPHDGETVTQVFDRTATATVAQHICMLIQYSITRRGPTRLTYPDEDYASQTLISGPLMIMKATCSRLCQRPGQSGLSGR